MNLSVQRNPFNIVPEYYYCNIPEKSNKQSTLKPNVVTGNRYDVSIYKNKGITLPFKAESTAVYAGSFDPITKGHLDIIKAASDRFGKVIVLVGHNPKKTGFIPVDKRMELIKESVKDMNNVQVDSHKGLTVDYAKSHGANTLLRGLRTVSDFDSEMQMSEINRQLDPNIRTVFISSGSEYSAISSSAVREILSNNGDITKFVPKPVADYLKDHPEGK